MSIERVRTRAVCKPWGSTDLKPWNELGRDGASIGELWFERVDKAAPAPALLLKLLFTEQPLSIQVHPDDAFARSIGLARGKAEAWYILAATPGAEIGLGLKRAVTSSQLRAAIEDGSITGLLQSRLVAKDDFISVPAGTIHSIGKGLVLAEIQQRSDTTFRLFDHGFGRELHIDNAVACATAGPAAPQARATRLSDARCLLIASPHFVVERVVLPARSSWRVEAGQETWFLVLEGLGRIGPLTAMVGQAVLLDACCAGIDVDADDLKGLLAYPGPVPCANLLRRRRTTTASTVEAHA
jgi:mannose-6-phosphate isomerase